MIFEDNMNCRADICFLEVCGLSGGLDCVSDDIGKCHLDRCDGFMATNLCFTDFAIVSKGEPNKDYTSPNNTGHYYSGYKHVESPSRHFRLRYSVIFGTLILICGLYYFGHAFRNITTLSREAGAAYLIAGMSLIVSGVIIAFTSGFANL